MLLIYTQKITPRIIYVFKHVCTGILGISIKFTTKIEEFIAHEGMKLSYGKQPLGKELFIQKVDLLTEQGFSEVEIKVQPWEDSVCFFSVPEASALPFDIFAASFYLLSRYEEYVPHVKDEAERFPVSESLAYQEGFLSSPVVDKWALKFRKVLEERFPDIEFQPRIFEANAVMAVENIFAYKNKGVLRSIAGLNRDLLQFNFNKVFDRIKVAFRVKNDPFNIFGELIDFIKAYRLKMFFMFQLSNFSIHDRNINYNRIPGRSVIKYVGDYAKVGLLQGYYAVRDLKSLRTEKIRMENIVHSSLEYVLNSRHDLGLPENYNNLVELEVHNDFSMGYPDAMGFRAGTCTPFLFYDINMEVTTPLLLHPYVFNSEIYEKAREEHVYAEVKKALNQVKEVGGTFRAIFKNQDFSEYSRPAVYYNLLKQIYEIE
ncbi:polysaccharide deacetylase family protein [Zunongwangia sp. F363]|uniref:Polysaccharide deacetylase family protein n=1 Tax=Autumnicola tepida TaxID=3075595 RepID=A0ABU3CEX9_9FLAO|nr:polysaccharide deacetylase family protein [Zunongwangia sp. F363]MDT0644803.1 polysaccharide deacetylase family protein [Zunongwangia sp. F363]